MLVMQGGLAELYSDNLSQEVKKGCAERRAQGLYCGLLPFGAAKGEDGVPVPDPGNYPGLVMAFELFSGGHSNRDIARSLNEHGYRTAGNQGNRPRILRDQAPARRFDLGGYVGDLLVYAWLRYSSGYLRPLTSRGTQKDRAGTGSCERPPLSSSVQLGLP